jgi:hypothetical protein
MMRSSDLQPKSGLLARGDPRTLTLKKLVADLSLDKDMLQSVIGKNLLGS